jgi:hypothetical protein
MKLQLKILTVCNISKGTTIQENMKGLCKKGMIIKTYLSSLIVSSHAIPQQAQSVVIELIKYNIQGEVLNNVQSYY